MKHQIWQNLTCLVLFCASSAAATTIAEDFEGVTAPAIPSGWSVVGTGISTAANGVPGNNLEVASGSARYLVNDGSGFDATVDFSGTFDFRLGGGNDFYDNISFFVGDVDEGLTTTSGDHFRVDLKRATFSRRVSIYDATGNTDSDKLFNGDNNNTYQMSSLVWYNAAFSWTASTGTFEFTWDDDGNPGNGFKGGTMLTGHSFNDDEVFFGFGTIQEEGRFDNLSITGTAVPEPGVALLGGLGLLALLRRRR